MAKSFQELSEREIRRAGVAAAFTTKTLRVADVLHSSY